MKKKELDAIKVQIRKSTERELLQLIALNIVEFVDSFKEIKKEQKKGR